MLHITYIIFFPEILSLDIIKNGFHLTHTTYRWSMTDGQTESISVSLVSRCIIFPIAWSRSTVLAFSPFQFLSITDGRRVNSNCPEFLLLLIYCLQKPLSRSQLQLHYYVRWSLFSSDRYGNSLSHTSHTCDLFLYQFAGGSAGKFN
jgi:hypothetical protein